MDIEDRDMWHRKTRDALVRQRDSLRVKQVIARHKDYDELLNVLEYRLDGDGVTVIVAAPPGIKST